jgi:hypothetical protein
MKSYIWTGAILCLSAATACGQGRLQIQHVSEPAGKTLDKALEHSALIQPSSKPFHVRLEIHAIPANKNVPASALPSAETYSATIDEVWVSPNEWVRTVKASSVQQTVVMNATGMHYVATGDYFPNWLRCFVTALVDPVPNAAQFDKANGNISYIVLPNGGRSNPELHGEFMLGVAPAQQINFTDVDFFPDMKRIQFVLVPGYSMLFDDYQPFRKLEVPRKLTHEMTHDVSLEGSVVTLEDAPAPDTKMFETPTDTTEKDPLQNLTVSAAQLMTLGGHKADLAWPAQIPGKGMFTVWVCLDRAGKIREYHTMNTDLSGFAADMAKQLEGRQWSAPTQSGSPIQVMGAIVYAYPPEPAQ